MDKLDQMAEAVAVALRGFVTRSLAALAQRVEAIEARQPEKGESGPRGEKGDVGPIGTDGRDGAPGQAGKDVDPEFVRAQVAEAVKAIPPARDGRDGKDAAPVDVDAIVKSVVAQIRVPADGRDGQDAPDLESIVKAVVAEIPEPLPGRDGRDGAPGIVGQKGEDGRNGADGRDGFGLEDLAIDLDPDGRTLRLRFIGGESVVERSIRFNTMIYRGIWKQARYVRGDTATFAGSLWHANKDTDEKPGSGSPDWTLCAKRGADGK